MRSEYDDSLTLQISMDACTVEVFRKGEVDQQQRLGESCKEGMLSPSAAVAHHKAMKLDELRSFNTEQKMEKLPSWLPSLNTSSHNLDCLDDAREDNEDGVSTTERGSDSDEMREVSSREDRFSSLKSWSVSSNIMQMPTEKTDNRSNKEAPALGPWIKGHPPHEHQAPPQAAGCSGFMLNYFIPKAMTRCTHITITESSDYNCNEMADDAELKLNET